LQIIDGFAAVIGITAVALAGAALMMAMSWQLVAVASIGAAVAAVGLLPIVKAHNCKSKRQLVFK
jgi:hypothetical protein